METHIVTQRDYTQDGDSKASDLTRPPGCCPRLTHPTLHHCPDQQGGSTRSTSPLWTPQMTAFP